MKTFIAALIFVGSVTACASESKLKIDDSSREVAQADREKGVQPVERPESLKSDSPAYRKHKEYLKFIDRHDKR